MLLQHCFYLFFILITPINSASLKRSHNETSNYEEFRDITVQVPDPNETSNYEEFRDITVPVPLITHNEISSNEEGESRDLCIGPFCIQSPDNFFRSVSNYIYPTVCETNSCEQSKIID